MSPPFPRARVAAPRPALLLADDPTGNRDGANGRGITHLLFSLRDGHGAAPELTGRSDTARRWSWSSTPPNVPAWPTPNRTPN